MEDTRANRRMNRRVKTKEQWINDTKILLLNVSDFYHMIGEINNNLIVTNSQIILHPISNFDKLYSYTSNIIHYLGESNVQEILIDCTNRVNCPAEINPILFMVLMSLVFFINESEYGKPFIETFSKPFTDDDSDFEAYFTKKEEQQKNFDDKMINTYKQHQETDMYREDYDPKDYVHERTVITRSDTLANLNKMREKMLQQLKDIIEIYDKIKKAAKAKSETAVEIPPVIAVPTTPRTTAEYVVQEQNPNQVANAVVIDNESDDLVAVNQRRQPEIGDAVGTPANLVSKVKSTQDNPTVLQRMKGLFTRNKVVPSGGKRKTKKHTKKSKSRRVRKIRK